MNLKSIIQSIIFGSKWLLIPFLFKLIYSLIILMYHFVVEQHISNEHLMHVLEDIDIVMIANLVKMIITGSYNSFIDKSHGELTEKISSGLLKIKMSTSIMGVSSIHLLQSFVNAEHLDWDVVLKQGFIHGIFIVGSMILAVMEYLHEKSESAH